VSCQYGAHLQLQRNGRRRSLPDDGVRFHGTHHRRAVTLASFLFELNCASASSAKIS
jgi:hypothetical protein